MAAGLRLHVKALSLFYGRLAQRRSLEQSENVENSSLNIAQNLADNYKQFCEGRTKHFHDQEKW